MDTKHLASVLLACCILNTPDLASAEVPNWQSVATQSLDRQDVQFSINETTHSLRNDPVPIIRYYQERQIDRFTSGSLSEVTRNSLHAKLGKSIIDGSFTYPNYDSVALPGAPNSWSSDIHPDRTWRWLHHQLIAIRYLIAADAVSDAPGHSAYLDQAKDLVVGWSIANYAAEFPSDMSWHDHGTAYRLRNFILLFEYARRDAKNGEFLPLLLSLIHSHCLVLSDESFYSRLTNHGFDQAMILYWAVKLVPEMEGARDLEKLAADRLRQEISFMFTPEGVHVENSPGYHLTMLRSLEFLQGLFRAYNDNESADLLSPIIDRAWIYMAYATKPNGRIPLIGDTSRIDLRAHRPGVRNLPSYDWFRYSATGGAEGSRPPTEDLFLPLSGYAIMRDQWRPAEDFDRSVYLLFKCGILSQYHRQDDDLSIVLYAFGQDWIIDSGQYNYNENDPMRRYMRSPLAHNTIVPDDHPQPVRNMTAIQDSTGIIGYGRRDQVSFVEGRTGMYPGMQARRHVAYHRPNRFLLRDELIGDQATTITTDFSIIFHVPRDKMVKIENRDTVSVRSSAGEMNIHFSDTPSSITLETGSREPRINGWRSELPNVVEEAHCISFHFPSSYWGQVIESCIELKPSDGN